MSSRVLGPGTPDQPRRETPERTPHQAGRPSSDGSPSETIADQSSLVERLRHLDRMDAKDLRALAASMPTIEQAKGVLMGCYGVDAATAFAVLDRLSSSKNVKLRELAALVVEAASSPAPGVGVAVSACEQVGRVLNDDGKRDQEQRF